jgi:hypothetical protein
MPKLTKKQQGLARARAQKFGRPFPNPIDVGAVVRRRGSGTGAGMSRD